MRHRLGAIDIRLASAIAALAAVLLTSTAAGGSTFGNANKPPPQNRSLPTLSGVAQVGQTLTASTGSWTGGPTGYRYAWQNCDADGAGCIGEPGASGSSRTLASGDAGRTMRVVVTATNDGGSSSATSAASAVIAAAPAPTTSPTPSPTNGPPVNTAPPVISGSTVEGAILSGTTGSWSGSPTSYAYQWRTCDASGAGCANLSGAVAASYVLTAEEVGKTLRLVVTAKNDSGSASVVSSATAAVTQPAPVPAPTPSPGAGCTLFASPGGSASASGTTASTPTSLTGAYQKTVAGSVVCLMGGTYWLSSPLYMSKGGTSSAWVTWRPYDSDTPVIKASFTTSASVFGFSGSADYIEIDGLTIDGQNDYEVGAAFHAFQGTHHHRLVGNTILNMSSAGIMTTGSDYLIALKNRIWHFGAGKGWSSGISVNNGNGAYWADTSGGFHNVIAGNVIGGGVDNSSYHSDGNGVILDLGGNIPTTLIANNVIYMNGGRGINSLKVTGKVYVVNNTLFDNGLDTRMSGVAELTANGSSNQVWANNVALAWTPRYTYQLYSGASVSFSSNDQYAGLGTQYVSGLVTNDASQIRTTAPLFAAPPSVDPSADGQWQNAPQPSALGAALSLQAGSPLVDTAKDPRTLPGLNSELLAGIDQYVMKAVDGTARPQGRGFDFGAYER